MNKNVQHTKSTLNNNFFLSFSTILRERKCFFKNGFKVTRTADPLRLIHLSVPSLTKNYCTDASACVYIKLKRYEFDHEFLNSFISYRIATLRSFYNINKFIIYKTFSSYMWVYVLMLRNVDFLDEK